MNTGAVGGHSARFGFDGSLLDPEVQVTFSGGKTSKLSGKLAILNSNGTRGGYVRNGQDCVI